MNNTDLPVGGSPAELPALTRAALARLRDSGELPAPAWEKALALCGFIPDRRDWFAYWRQIFLLCGALFFLSGVIFFIAWNWAEMHRFARMAMVGAIVAASGVGALARGLDTRLGQVLLLSCGIAIGPMLAVFGQTYQTGAELWELFRVWTALLILLAVAGKQAGLWFVAWLSGNVFIMLWLGRNMTEPLEALGMFTTLPECLLALSVAIIVWEWAAWKFRGNVSYAWLESRWLPRLLFFDLTCRITGYCIMTMFSSHSWSGLPELFLPHIVVIPPLGILLAGASWYWYRKRAPDLFMLAVVLGSLAVIFVSFLIKIEFLFYADISAIFAWGLLITGLTAGMGKILLTLQRSMETGIKKGQNHALFARAFFGTFRPELSWENLWAQLQAHGFLAPKTPLPSAKGPGSPWYVQSMLAFGGWVAALLFMTFLVLLLFMTLRIRTNEGLTLFGVALPVIAVGGASLRHSGMFLRHFGFALALAGVGCASPGIFIMLDGGRISFFLAAAFILGNCVLINSAVFRALGAMAVACCMAVGIASLGYWGIGSWMNLQEVSPGLFLWTSYAPTVWWAFLCIVFSAFHLRERSWRGTSRGRIAEPIFYGMFAGMLSCQIIALSSRFGDASNLLLFVGGARSVALGAAAGLMYLAWILVRKRKDDAERGFVMFCAGASLPLAWFLPGAALAFFGLSIARFIGNSVMQGAVAAYFFVYMIYYYYFLGVTLLAKSLLLAATGILLLLFAYCLGRYAAGIDAEIGERRENHA